MEWSRNERESETGWLFWSGVLKNIRYDVIVCGVVRMSDFCFVYFHSILFPQIAVCADVKEVLLSDGNEKAIQSILIVRTSAGV